MTKSRVDYLMQHTYHSLYGEMQLELHHNYSLATAQELRMVDQRVATLLLDRPQETTTNYRCEQRLPNNDVAEAICTDWMLRSRSTHSSFVYDFLAQSSWVSLATGRATRQALLASASASHSQPASACIMPRVCASEPCPEPPTVGCHGSRDSGNRFVVTYVANCTADTLAHLQLLATSLVGVDRVARIVVLVPAQDSCYEQVTALFVDQATVLTIEFTLDSLSHRDAVAQPLIALASFLQHMSQVMDA
jgi:hypothetical protein